jgi:hypothetical protein
MVRPISAGVGRPSSTTVEQWRAHPHRGGAGRRALGQRQRRAGLGLEARPVDVGRDARRQRQRCSSDFARRLDRLRLGQRHGQRLRRRCRRFGRPAEHFEAVRDRIDPRQQARDNAGRGLTARQQVFYRRFQTVRHLTQAHRAGQPRAALEGVQRAHARGGRRQVRRPA